MTNTTVSNCLIPWGIPMLKKNGVRSLNPLSCCCFPSLGIPDLKHRLQALNLLILILPEPNRNTLKVTTCSGFNWKILISFQVFI